MATHSENSSSTWMTWNRRGANALVSVFTYLLHYVYPVNLAVFYPYPAAGYPMWQRGGGAARSGRDLASWLSIGRRQGSLPAGRLVLVFGDVGAGLGLISVSGHALADRYMYLPGDWIVDLALAWSRGTAGWPPRRPGWLCRRCAVAVIVIFAALARQTDLVLGR